MKPYLIEGLDCSGKKAVAALVHEHFNRHGDTPVEIRIGPLAGGALKRIDDHLTNIRTPLRRGSGLDRLRRGVYLIGPIFDWVLFRPSEDITAIKVSSHYRAYARAIIEHDDMLEKWFERTSPFTPRFSGCTYLTASFETRLSRHRQDYAHGRTDKVEPVRFLKYDSAKFDLWDSTMLMLLRANVPHIQELSTDNVPVAEVAQQVISHISLCRTLGEVEQ